MLAGMSAEILPEINGFGNPRRAGGAGMKQHRVAILGGAGFIGRYVVKRLAERGDVLTVGGRHAASAKFLKLKGDVGQVGLVNLSIDDETLLPAFVANNDSVVNLVGILHESGGQRFEIAHHVGPARLARLAREAGAERFVHLSAIGADPRSSSAYARTKAAGEEAVRDAFPTATILRPSLVFGPEDQFFNRFGALATISPVLPLIGGGETRFQPVYVGDVADAVVRCIDDSTTAGRTYELGGPKVYSFRALIELLLAQIRRKRLLLDIPFGLATVQARLMSVLPNPPLTPDQIEMLKRDNVVSSGALTLASLGITPTPLEAILPSYVNRFRRGGWYARERAV
jgi:NADH dehydrogenase